MQKCIIIFCCFFLISLNIFSQKAFQDPLEIMSTKDLQLVGNISSVREKVFVAKGTRYNLMRTNLISDTKYNITNDNKVLISSIQNKGTLTEYKYNSKNQLVEIANIYTRNNAPAGKTIYNYDRTGKLILELNYLKDGSLADSIVIFENAQTNRIIKNHHNSKGELFKTVEIKLNTAGKVERNLQTINNETTRIIFEYDSTLTKLAEERWYLGNKLMQRIQYIYNWKDDLIEKVELDENGKRSGLTQYEYDIISGLVISMKTSHHFTSYEYNFDEYNNWITKYEFYNDVPLKIIEREIKYLK